MRARDSRLADRLMFVVSVTTNLSQRIAGRLVQLPAPVTFILSQLGPDQSQDREVANGRIRRRLCVVKRALRISLRALAGLAALAFATAFLCLDGVDRSEEHTSEL